MLVPEEQGHNNLSKSFMVDYFLRYRKNPKNCTRNLLEKVNDFSNLEGCKINTQKSVVFLYTKYDISEKEIISFMIELKQ